MDSVCMRSTVRPSGGCLRPKDVRRTIRSSCTSGLYAEIPSLVREIPAAAEVLAARFWPGPLTLIMRRAARVPDEVTAGLDTVAIRIPAHRVAQALLRAARIPVAAPSANLFSRPSPTRASHVLEDLEGRIDMVVDGGDTSVGVESTVLDLTTDVPRLLRPGAVTLAQIRESIGAAESVQGGIQDGPLPSPGLLEKHYSPRAPLTLYKGGTRESLERLHHDVAELLATGRRIGLLLATEDRALMPGSDRLVIADLGSAGDLAGVAARLYAALRELDAANVDIILARDFSADGGLGTAIHDRLRRAAAGNLVRTPSA